MDTTEYTFRSETVAKDYRRKLIVQGISVSLIGFDTERELYVFDAIWN
jgi:hypothetical protein